MISVRPPAVAGSFYSADSKRLTNQLALLFESVTPIAGSIQHPVKALIVPHAGYQYSGTTAAQAYQLLKPDLNIERIVIIGPCHRVFIHGLAVPSCDYFSTPLGELPIDKEALSIALRFAQVQVNDPAHQQEHSIEVQLPFVQRIYGEMPILPIVFGDVSSEKVAEVLSPLLDLPGTLLLVSSDLSHFHDYNTARRIDLQTTQLIEDGQYQLIDHNRACGSTGINALLKIAKEKNWKVSTLSQCNSGDTAGDHSRVVGYGAYAIY
ncbi:AmmeMemoRadiSam system protein B [Aliikangiella sp. G2MR2-5]|uniref:AmmeMemoRadiSam system protein B n=1 Tax=Aliikangiella sp. G2MR2-5 TaxID=2788943 RepID=UPI0018AC7757|nr:AmmeMemoRadiSam system protein B [Aliikangiella sp. G2MR2-5]